MALPAKERLLLRRRAKGLARLHWVIDQYQVSTDKRSGITSDPNRADDPEYIVRLIGQAIRVSLDTLKLVNDLPAEFESPAAPAP